jgi:cytidine deaminase
VRNEPDSSRVRLSAAERRRLLTAAARAMARAYAPYSGTRVGAALLARSGRVFVGASMQNASSALNACAEQAAVTSAVAAGERRFRALAVVRSRGGACVPCGRCLQWLSEFVHAPDDLLVISQDGRAPVDWSLRYLQPVPYRRPPEDGAAATGRSGRPRARARGATPRRASRRRRA